jgi:outer membrane receptor protein involved in Fe transport
VFLGVAVAAAASPSVAQSPAGRPPPAKPPGATVGEVTVQGAPPPVRTSIDRNSYSVASDLQATTGSIADALRNVPSLEVDVNGNVALRGDPNVTILIDGKPSGQFQGDTKAQALQSLPADQIDRVEVITNPSAAFDPNGSAGIINLITKKTRKPGVNGSLRANVGANGRQNGGVSGSYRDGPITLSGDASFRHDSIKQSFERDRGVVEADGRVRESEVDGVQGGRINLVNLRGGLDWDIDAKSRLSVELRYADFDFLDRLYERLDETVAGTRSRAYDRFARNAQDRPNAAGTIRYRREFGEGHTLDLDFGRERIGIDNVRTAQGRNRLPGGRDFYDRVTFDALFWKTTAKAEYARPLSDGAKLKLGYSLEADDNDYDNRGARGTGPGDTVPDAALTNLFKFDQQAHAVYGTYERPFGKLTALAGLRMEAVRIDLDQVTQGLRAENDDVSFYPSLHLSYALSEGQKLKASYSRRIQRPQPGEYNPYRIFIDPQNFRSGNPDLKPQTTDSFELGYELRRNGAIYQATFYYRDVRDAVNEVVRDLGGGVFVTTRANVGEGRTAGLELVANGRITRDLTFNVSGNAYWTEIDGRGVGVGGRLRDGVTAAGRANLSWQVTDKDFLQLNGFLNGKRLSPQGQVQPMGAVNLGYRHKFDDRLSAVVTVQDLFSTIRFKSVIDTPFLRDVQVFEPKSQGVYVGFTYTFGGNGGRQRDPGFDFGGAGPPSP